MMASRNVLSMILNTMQLSDSALYYFQRKDKILNPSYTPNEQDVLQSHVKTTEIVETTLQVG